MKNLGIEKLVEEINRLNPGVSAYTGSTSSDFIFLRSKTDPHSLKLPSGYYYSEKNGITNKHNTEDGTYEAFCIV